MILDPNLIPDQNLVPSGSQSDLGSKCHNQSVTKGHNLIPDPNLISSPKSDVVSKFRTKVGQKRTKRQTNR